MPDAVTGFLMMTTMYALRELRRLEAGHVISHFVITFSKVPGTRAAGRHRRAARASAEYASDHDDAEARARL